MLSAPGSDASDYVPADISQEQQLSYLKAREDAYQSASAAVKQMHRYFKSKHSLDEYKMEAADRDFLSPIQLATADGIERSRM